MSTRPDNSEIEAINRRWTSTESILNWHSLPSERRDRVLAELEENARETSARDPLLASDLNLALDVLDTRDNAPLLQLLQQAQADIRALLTLSQPNLRSTV